MDKRMPATTIVSLFARLLGFVCSGTYESYMMVQLIASQMLLFASSGGHTSGVCSVVVALVINCCIHSSRSSLLYGSRKPGGASCGGQRNSRFGVRKREVSGGLREH